MPARRFADLDCWRCAKDDVAMPCLLGGLLTSIVGGVQKLFIRAINKDCGLLTSIVGGVQKIAIPASN